MKDFFEFDFVVISVMGPHAGESEKRIFNRKINDIKTTGKTFWLVKSHQAEPSMIQAVCNLEHKNKKDIYCYFIEPSRKGAAIPTKTANHAKKYSLDSYSWVDLPRGLSPVTGAIDNKAYALVFDDLRLADGILNLWNYANAFDHSKPLKIIRGESTVCAVKKDMSRSPDIIKSNQRKIVAIGRLCNPWGVWLSV